MAGVGMQHGGVSAGAMNGARAAYEADAPMVQENIVPTKSQSRNGSQRQNSGGSSRTPLSTVAPNRKGTSEYTANGRPTHNRIDELGQQSGVSRSGSEPDSLLDLYRHHASNGNSTPHSIDNDIPENMYKPEDINPEGWIHRDKLAKIESEELQAAGINLANAKRGVGVKAVKRETSRSKRSDELSRDNSQPRREEKKPRLSEPAVAEEDERANWDLRTPDEIAADNAAAQFYSNPVLKKSGSKIPILTSSPVPIPPERLERDTPIPRKRTMSNSMSPEDSFISKTGVRKNSTGSQILLDDDNFAGSPTTADGSRMTSKAGSPTKRAPKASTTSPPGTATARKVSSHARKTSNSTKPGQPASPSQRTGTKSGDVDRPRTAVNRPEGPPPWLATMYKPDPMLPPDQQIIPTHARKQQQQQWTDEGAVPITYDRQFSPLAIHTPEGLIKNSSPPRTSPMSEKTEDPNAWPLKPMPSVRSSTSGRPGTSGSITGVYSTMPKVQSAGPANNRPGVMATPRAGQPNVAAGRIQEQRPPVPAKDDDGTVKKGCGCCVVM